MSTGVTLKIGLMSQEEYQQRTLEIAKGERKSQDEPKLWVTSLESLAKVLSPKNKELLDIIQTKQPQSLQEVATLTKRDKGNVSRTLKLLNHYGIITLKKNKKGALVPGIKFDRIQIDYPLKPGMVA